MNGIIRRRPPVDDPAVFRHLVRACYDAVGEGRAGWSRFLEKLCATVDGNMGSLMIQDGFGGSPPKTVVLGVDPPIWRAYEEHYHSKNVYIPVAVSKGLLIPGAIHAYHEIIAPSIARKTEFYDGWLRHIDWYDGASALLAVEGRWMSFLNVCVGPNGGLFAGKKLQIVRRIAPHARRALRIQRRLGRLIVLHEAAVATLDQMPLGVILVEGTGRMFFVNRVAEEILSARDGLTSSADGLHAATAAETAQLRSLISHALRGDASTRSDADGSMSLQRPSLKRPLSILVGPLPLGHATISSRAAAVVFVTDPEAGVESTPFLLQRLYGLSLAESRLAALLLQGMTLQRAADEIGISLHTARNQSKSIFQKTGTRRQAELIRILASGPALLRRPPGLEESS